MKKYMQKYKDEYSKQYSCIVKLSKSDEHTFCTIFSADISTSRILPYFGALSLILNFAGWHLCKCNNVLIIILTSQYLLCGTNI